MSSLYITNVRLPPPSLLPLAGGVNDINKIWTVECSDGMVTDVSPVDDSGQGLPVVDNGQILNARGSIMLPSYVLSYLRLNDANNYDECD